MRREREREERWSSRRRRGRRRRRIVFDGKWKGRSSQGRFYAEMRLLEERGSGEEWRGGWEPVCRGKLNKLV